MSQTSSDKFSRRLFLQGSGAAAAATALTGESVAAAASTSSGLSSTVIRGKQTITLNVNGVDREVEVEPRTTLLDVLRYQLDLTGAKPVSSDGSSGASTVLIDDRPATASNTLAVSLAGKKIQTVESLGAGPDEVCVAFLENDAQQCGFCTPGFVIGVRAFLNRNPDATEEEIREGLNGNICRCGTYTNVLHAALHVVRGGAR